jgi:hypothetical protein
MAVFRPIEAMLGANQPPETQSPTGKELVAHDFTYDKTGLPRYPDSVQSVVSSISYPHPDKSDEYRTSSAIATSSSFDTVVAWYQNSLPGGWHGQTVGDMHALGAQLSPDKIMQSLVAGVTESNPQSAVAAPTAAAPTPAAEVLRLSIFTPPTGTSGKAGIMIFQKGDNSVAIMIKASTTA